MRRRHLVFAAIIALAAASLAVGTGADTVTYDDVDTLELQPAGEGTYVQEGEDGEIRVVVGDEDRGVNDNAVTDLGAVFTVENVLRFGDPTTETANRATIWIETDGNDAVTFYDIDTGEPIESEGDGVALSPGEMASVGMSVDTTGPTPDITTLTVYATVEDLAFESIEVEPSDETLDLNEERDVTATAIANDETIDVSEAVEITDSSTTVEVDESGSVTTIRTVNPEGRHPKDGFLEVAVGDHTERVEFDISWRETNRPVNGENGGVATFDRLGVFERIEFDAPVNGDVTVEAFEELPETSEVPQEEILQAIEIDVPEENADTDAALRFTLDRSTVDADLNDLTVVYGPGGEFATLGADDLEELDTDAYVDGDTVVVEADTLGFSAFAVTEGPITSEPSTGSSVSESSSSSTDDSDDSDAGGDDTSADDAGTDDSEGGETTDSTAGTGDSTPDDSEADEDRETDGDAVAAAGGGLPIEIGGIVSGTLWYLLALGAATLFLLFAYRRRDDEDPDVE